MSREHRTHRIILEDEYTGIKYWIVENGLYTEDGNYDMKWYCAYVLPPHHLKDMDTDELEVHGGITWNGFLNIIGLEVWGWDYNHCYDMVDGEVFKTKLQSKPIEEVVDIIASECQEFIRRYLI